MMICSKFYYIEIHGRKNEHMYTHPPKKRESYEKDDQNDSV